MKAMTPTNPWASDSNPAAEMFAKLFGSQGSNYGHDNGGIGAMVGGAAPDWSNWLMEILRGMYPDWRMY